MPLSDGLIDNVVLHRFQSISELMQFTKSGNDICHCKDNETGRNKRYIELPLQIVPINIQRVQKHAKKYWQYPLAVQYV